MRKLLTNLSVKTTPSNPTKRLEMYDAGSEGLILTISPTGSRSWIMRFRRNDGRMGKLTLGPVDYGAGLAEPKIGGPLTLAGARKMAADIRHKRAQGIDVFEEKQAAKRQKTDAQADTFTEIIIGQSELEDRMAIAFGSLAQQFIERHAKPNTRRWQETARLLGFDASLSPIRDGLAERWKNRSVAEVTKKDIIALLDECRSDTYPGAVRRRPADRESEGMAGGMFAALSKFYAWLIARDIVDRSPLTGLEKPRAPASRTRVLSDAELKSFWTASGKLGAPFGPLFRLLLLTGQRRDEAANMRRSDVDAHGVWKIPGDIAKNGRDHYVALAPLARRIVAEAKGDGLLFSTTGVTAVSGFSKAKAALDEEMKVDDWRLHDLRRTVASQMASLGVAVVVIEKCLNHVSGSTAGIVGVYQRYSYAQECKEAFEKWEKLLSSIVN